MTGITDLCIGNAEDRGRGKIIPAPNIGFEAVTHIHYPVDTPRVLPYHRIT